MSSVPRGIAMIPLLTNGKINGKPSFLFYQPGEYKTALSTGTSVAFVTETKFPENGKVSISVNPSVKEAFAVLLRKPYWAADFTITVNGKEEPITDKEVAILDRTWSEGDKIDISFIMPVKVLDGGISYPGSVALQRGPQVLVFDHKLNPTLNDGFSIQPDAVQLKEAASILPAKWVGLQAYQLEAKVKGKNEQIILVPYADASQTGGEVITWLRKQ
jgi:DUF1680 family protein